MYARVAAVLAVICLIAPAWPKERTNIVHVAGPIEIRVSTVRSVAPETRFGLTKSLPLLRVEALGYLAADDSHPAFKTEYVLYCVDFAPQEGHSYTGTDMYIDAPYSALHLWPATKESLGVNERGRLYRVIMFENVLAGSHPNASCDVKSAQDAK